AKESRSLPTQITETSDISGKEQCGCCQWIPGNDKQRTVVEAIRRIKRSGNTARGQSGESPADPRIGWSTSSQRKNDHHEWPCPERWNDGQAIDRISPDQLGHPQRAWNRRYL